MIIEKNFMKNLKMWGGLLALVFIFGLASSALANEGTPSIYDCNQDPMYSRDFNGQTTISSRLRSVPCMDQSEVIRVLEKGKVIKVIGEMDGWYQVKDSDGVTGWVGATLIKTTEANVTATKEAATSVDNSLVSRLKGYILLQVEQKGEAWYVSPVDGFRYFLKDGNTAYDMMRKMGLGISNANLAKLKAKDAALINKLKGRIVLQVENNGEAYYVNPKTGALSYLKNGSEAYKVMRNLSLGVKNQDLAKIASKDVAESKVETTNNNTNGSIVLTGAWNKTKANLNWSLKNMTSSQGFKVVIASHENPVYPGDEYHYLTGSGARSDYWSSLKPGTYYFRVCEYLGGKCGVYSNNVKLIVPETTVTSSGSITLTGSVDEDGAADLNWSLKDMTSSMGFKVVVSDQENPVYPGNEYHYFSDSSVRSDSWGNLSGTKYFRVCEYLGGKCGVYSNNLELNF